MGFLDLIVKPAVEVKNQSALDSKPVEVKPVETSSVFNKIENRGIVGVPDDKFIQMLENVITDNNIPGLDYVEFKQALDNMKDVPIDETTKFITVFSILKSQGSTKEKLLTSIDVYIDIINNELLTFNNELAETFKENVENKKLKITQSQEKIIVLSNEIKELNEFVMVSTQEVQQEEMKLKMTESNFKQSVDKVISTLSNDKQKINNYIQ